MLVRLHRRLLAAGAVLPALVAGTLSATPAAAASWEQPASLRAAIASGDSSYSALPRGWVRRAPTPSGGSLRTSAAVPAESLGPVARGNLTSAPVSTFNVTYRTDGATWTDEAKAAFEAAVAVWERTLESAVPIEISATAKAFDDPSLLGGAGPYDFRRNNQGTPSEIDDVFEPVALANARRSVDTLPGEPDIVAEFNPDLDGLYFGIDGNPPADEIDFRTVVLHEIGHGLGLVGTAAVDAGGKATVGDRTVNQSGIRSGTSYDTFTYATTAQQAGNGGSRILSLADGSAELKNALTGNSLYWSGQLARTAAGGGKVRLYAPFEFFEGTSYGHLDESSYPGEHANGLMTPFIEPGESISDVGQIAMGMLADLGFAVPALRGSRYTAVDPRRLLDTRNPRDTTRNTRVGPREVVDLRVTGTSGVPADATAVVLNVTAVQPTEATDIRVYPTPVVLSPVPTVSSLNLSRGATRANLVTVAVGNNGRVRLRNNAGTVALLADLAGYYSPSAAATYTPTEPTRVLNTSKGVGVGRTTPLGPGEFVDLPVAGDGRPAPAGASAVALTVTALGASRSTDVRVYPTPADSAAPPPGTSSLNLGPGAPVPNVVVVKVGSDGSVRLRNTSGSLHLLADLSGWYDGSLSGSLFRPVTPSRVLDTRTRVGTSPEASTTVGPTEVLTLRVGGRNSVPSLSSAAVLNLTGVAATADTDVRVYPADAATHPQVSNLNLGRGHTAADMVMVKLAGRSVNLRNTSGQVALVADVAGWFGPAT